MDKKEDNQAKNKDQKDLGITIKKEEDFGEWFSQVIIKAELIEYTDVSGCYVFRPNSYEIWQKVQNYMDKEFKKHGVRNMQEIQRCQRGLQSGRRQRQ
ncbi:MAG: hypothetical protein NT001_05835 [Candidatus Woesearchaeota archaeon]|nr:hypothetical protein [Candidatus Woesearchaeota archaeon]